MTNQISHLDRVPFNDIINHQKTIEARLYDEKRQILRPGDVITYINRDDPEQTVSVIVVGLLWYSTFTDLYSHNDPEKFGGASAEILDSQVERLYSMEEQLKNGVIGIEFEII